MADWRTRGLVEDVICHRQICFSLSHGGLEEKGTSEGHHESKADMLVSHSISWRTGGQGDL